MPVDMESTQVMEFAPDDVVMMVEMSEVEDYQNTVDIVVEENVEPGEPSTETAVPEVIDVASSPTTNQDVANVVKPSEEVAVDTVKPPLTVDTQNLKKRMPLLENLLINNKNKPAPRKAPAKKTKGKRMAAEIEVAPVVQRIQSFVLFDLETTGLPSGWKPVKITELAMHAISRQSFLSNDSYENMRVMNKLVMCVNPQTAIDRVAAQITGLTNELLKYENKFDKAMFLSLHNFIDRLPRPVCLVAHNGNSFDFPIFQAELAAIGEKLHDDLLCVDSLHLFRNLIPKGSYASPPEQNGPAAKKRLKTALTLKNHKLDELHKFLVSVRKRENAHSAEADVYSLAKCILARNSAFVELADLNAKLFSATNKMW